MECHANTACCQYVDSGLCNMGEEPKRAFPWIETLLWRSIPKRRRPIVVGRD